MTSLVLLPGLASDAALFAAQTCDLADVSLHIELFTASRRVERAKSAH